MSESSYVSIKPNWNSYRSVKPVWMWNWFHTGSTDCEEHRPANRSLGLSRTFCTWTSSTKVGFLQLGSVEAASLRRTDEKLQEEAAHGPNDARTVMTVISAAVITSILSAFKQHISIPYFTEVFKTAKWMTYNGGGGEADTLKRANLLNGAPALWFHTDPDYPFICWELRCNLTSNPR